LDNWIDHGSDRVGLIRELKFSGGSGGISNISFISH